MSSESDQSWYRLETLVQSPEVASALLWQLGALGVEIQDRETFMEGVVFAPVPEGWSRLIAFFDEISFFDEDDDDRRIDELVMKSFEETNVAAELVSFAPYDDRSWETAWMAFFKPVLLSRRSIVGPPWEDFEAPVGGTKIVIEPGMAFGTGTHETTQLCAQMLDDLLDDDVSSSVLDVGCGSAILSILAARHGATPVIGTDIDAYAIEVARENLRVNEIDHLVELSTTPVEDIEGTFDIVVANILGHILLSLKEGLRARVGPGSSLILGGITELTVDELERAFVEPGWRLIDRRQAGEWISLHLLREDEETPR
ncbi:MAG: 50S ribosomal protein L11 methyltransferase [Bradymonadaceae bacterium]